ANSAFERLKASNKIAQGKASPRATPWDSRPQKPPSPERAAQFPDSPSSASVPPHLCEGPKALSITPRSLSCFGPSAPFAPLRSISLRLAWVAATPLPQTRQPLTQRWSALSNLKFEICDLPLSIGRLCSHDPLLVEPAERVVLIISKRPNAMKACALVQ